MGQPLYHRQFWRRLRCLICTKTIRPKASTNYAPRWLSMHIPSSRRIFTTSWWEAALGYAQPALQKEKEQKHLRYSLFVICGIVLQIVTYRLFPPLHLFSFLYILIHVCRSFTSIFVTQVHLLLDFARGSGLVRVGDMEQEIKKHITHIMRLMYFLVDSMLTYFSFAN